VLEDAAKLERLLDDAQSLGATDLFVQVYRGGRAWYDSQLADAAPYRALTAATGLDTLAVLIERAHENGVRVHAWVNVLSLSQNRDAPILAELGRDAVLVDRRGRSLLDYPGLEVPEPDRQWYRIGTRGVYLDPATPGVAEHLVATFSELLTRYPGLDGLHLDYVRHPGVLPLVPGSRFGVGLDFGYGKPGRERFERETGLVAPTAPRMVNTTRWDAWRRDKVTELVARIANSARTTRPGIEVSAAVIAYADRAYQTLAQDWPRWVEDGLLDFAVPMIYTLDDRLLRYQAERFAGSPRGERIWAGLGSWLFASRPERAREQIAVAKAAGLRNIALFSYDSMAERPTATDAASALFRAISGDAPTASAAPGGGDGG
jgi:uncharacterized lipoprotein YddW (UPF0748 family)